jgi:class 3 adenylate cyclase
VIFEEGDDYGQTVNVASRIADSAQDGEVIVSHDVVDASDRAAVVFREVGRWNSRACVMPCACTPPHGTAERSCRR